MTSPKRGASLTVVTFPGVGDVVGVSLSLLFDVTDDGALNREMLSQHGTN